MNMAATSSPAETMATTPEKPVEKTAAPAPAEHHPLLALRDEMDRVFDDFFANFPLMPFRRRMDADPWRRFQGLFEATFPAVDVAESDKDYRITAELPGMEEKDIDISMLSGVLTLKGEKQEVKKEGKEDQYVSERRYGAFQRSFRLPEDADPDKIDAAFKNGVLTITLPKAPEAQTQRRKISVKQA
jgi:HSP20 family protein